MEEILEMLPLDLKKRKYNITSLKTVIKKMEKRPEFKYVLKEIKPLDFNTLLALDDLPRKIMNVYVKDLKIVIDPELVEMFLSLGYNIPYTIKDTEPIGIDGLSEYTELSPKMLKEIYKYVLKEIKKIKLRNPRDKPFGSEEKFKKYVLDKTYEVQNIFGFDKKIKIRKFKKKLFSSSIGVNSDFEYIYNKNIDFKEFHPSEFISTIVHELIHLQQYKGGNLFLPPSMIYEGFAHYFEEFARDKIDNMDLSYQRDAMLRLIRYKALYEFHTGMISKNEIYCQFAQFLPDYNAKIEYQGCLINPYKTLYIIGKYLFKKYTRGNPKLVMELANQGVWAQWRFLQKHAGI